MTIHFDLRLLKEPSLLRDQPLILLDRPVGPEPDYRNSKPYEIDPPPRNLLTLIMTEIFLEQGQVQFLIENAYLKILILNQIV